MQKRANPKALDEFYGRIEREHFAPLWERLANLVPSEPQIDALPYHWAYATARPLLLEAAGLIAEEDAERRVLILENPGLVGHSAVTNTLFAGLQVLMPGEKARAHRHTQAAVRFIIEGADAYTSVDGRRIDMSPGDLILTPSWRWHDHTHEGEAPVIWLDVLDIPLVRSIGSRFVEPYEEADVQAMSTGRRAEDTPPLRYAFEPAREALEDMRVNTECDACHGFKREYTDAATGGSVTPTISAYLQLLPSGFDGTAYQSTEGAVYCVVSGHGTVRVGDGDAMQEFAYRHGDVFTVPCWCPQAFVAAEETVLFSASDRGLQTHLGIWRERTTL